MTRPKDPKTTTKILSAALSILSERGYARTTLDEIVSEAKTSKAALYRRWPNKAALIADAVRYALEHANPKFEETDNPLDDLKTILKNIVEALEKTPFGGAMRVIVGAAQTLPELADALAEIEKERRGILTRPLLRIGIAERDLQLTTDLLLGPIYLGVLVRRTPLDANLIHSICSQLFPDLI